AAAWDRTTAMKRLAILLALLSLGWPAPARADLRAAAAKVDITPRNSQWLLGYQARQSDGVLDHIYHRVLALDAGGTPFYLISTDVCLFSPSFHDTVMRELQTRLAIDPAHIW